MGADAPAARRRTSRVLVRVPRRGGFSAAVLLVRVPRPDSLRYLTVAFPSGNIMLMMVIIRKARESWLRPRGVAQSDSSSQLLRDKTLMKVFYFLLFFLKKKERGWLVG